MNESIIFYGAGKNAELNLKKWKDNGIVPVCFADTDEKKQYTKFMGFDVLPLDEAVSRYSGYVIYITLVSKNLLSVTEYLIKHGVPQDRIRYFNSVEYRKGCWQMEGHIHVTDKLTPCSHWCFDREHGIPLSGEWESDYREYVSFVEGQRTALRAGNSCVCGNCPELISGLWQIEFEPRLLGLSDNIKGERCNCRCVYCDLTKSNGSTRCGKFTILDIFDGLGPFFEGRTQVYYAPAELTISPYKKEIFTFMKERGWVFSLIKTNGILYDEGLAGFLNTATPTRINVSLDSGTRETYKRVKGTDCFEKVLKNLRRYKDAGAKIELKYIVLDGINDNSAEIDAFAEISRYLDAQTIVTVDLNTLHTGIPEKIFTVIEYYIGKMKSTGLPVRLHSEHFNLMDYERIKRLLY